MDDIATFDSGLQVGYKICEETATVIVKGALVFPDAVGVTSVMKHVIEQLKPVVLLDLTDIEGVDATGVAVLVGIGGDLKNAGIQVRVIAPDPRIRHRLPYTLGLRKLFANLEEALAYETWAEGTGWFVDET